MLQYAADDVASVYDVLSAAAKLLDASRADFIHVSNQDDDFFFLKASFLDRFNHLDLITISDSERPQGKNWPASWEEDVRGYAPC